MFFDELSLLLFWCAYVASDFIMQATTRAQPPGSSLGSLGFPGTTGYLRGSAETRKRSVAQDSGGLALHFLRGFGCAMDRRSSKPGELSDVQLLLSSVMCGQDPAVTRKHHQ